jgi:hypothetical protein
VLQRALAPKPEDRYADAGELARALQTGLVQGGERMDQPFWNLRASELYVWRVLTALFAVGFLYLLLHGYR